jgi:ankyrin repeat protein/Cdc6-like AAA superfamily ATPase
MAALLATTEKVVRVISRGQVYESVYLRNKPATDSLSKNLQSALTTIYTTSLDVLAESASLFSKNTATRTLKAILNPGKVPGSLSAISEQEDDLLRDVSACEVRRSANADDSMIEMLNALNAPMKRVDENIQHLLQNMDQEQRVKMLEWISSIPFGKNHNNVKEKRTPGTGEWLLQTEDFTTWEQSDSSIFWLQGSLGTGKTYLTSAVIDRIQDRLSNTPKNEGFAFFYCDKNEPRRAQALSILQSIVRQLSTTAKSPGSTQKKLCELYNKCRDAGSTFSLEQCKEQIKASMDIYEKTTIVVDAMDECSTDRDKLVDALNSFVSQSNERDIKIFISSRPDHEIQVQLQTAPNIDINASDNRGDVQKYLEVELDKLAKKTPSIGRLKAKILDTLLERCQGMFQWAALQVHQIQKCKTESSIWKRLENLPDDIQKAYDEAWSQIEDFEEPDKVLTYRAMLWVMAAERPLSTSQLICAVRVNTKGEVPTLADVIEEESLLELCNSLLTIDSQQKVWRFAHLSVREYLETKMQWTLPRANLHAASACLSWLITMYDKDDNDEIDLSGWKGQPGPVDIFHLMHPFHLYMRHHWAKHVQKAQDDDEATLSSLLKTFLGSPEESSKQYQKWYEVIKDDLERIVDVVRDTDEFHFYLEAGGFDKEEFDTCDFNQAKHPEYGEFESELGPSDAAIYAMCHLSFAAILSDWWENAEFDVSRVNERGHNLLTIAARVGCTSICKKLVEKGADLNQQVEGQDYGSALHAAAHRGHTETVKYLIEAGADVNMTVENGEHGNALIAALAAEKVDTAKFLIQKAGADVNKTHTLEEEDEDEDGDPVVVLTPIALAAKIKGTELLKILVDAGANVNVSEQSGNPISAAIKSRNLEGAKYLIQKAKADVNLPISEGNFRTLLERASTDSRNLEIVKWLVEAGAEVNPSDCGENGTPLAAAARGTNNARNASSIEIVKYLVNAGADVHKGDDESSPVSLAVLAQDIEVLKYLIEVGGELNVQKEFEQSIKNGFFEGVKYLIEKGADVNKPLPEGDYGTALEYAAAKDTTLEIIKAMVEAGADVNLLSENGGYGSPLAAAVASFLGGTVNTAKYLIQKGADVNLSLPHGNYGNALTAAVAGSCNVEVVECLIEAGADVNALLQHGNYSSALEAAVVSGGAINAAKVQALVRAGADVNLPIKNGDYGSALAVAASEWDLEVVQVLLEAGADVNMPLDNGDYRSALTAAKAQEDNEEVIKLLEGRGATA